METVALSNRSTDAGWTLSDYQFALPPELIAQLPAERRDGARLMVLDRAQGALRHSRVSELPEHLRPGDLLVVNDTKVVPARLFGRTAAGGAVEVLAIRPLSGSLWLCLGKPTRRLREGVCLSFPDQVRAKVAAVHSNGHYSIAFEGDPPVHALLERHGEIPLPPYIHRPDGPLPLDRTRYQTIFASTPGAIAAPTAGFHFTDRLITALQQQGVSLARLTLHVGSGTFLPVRCENFREHAMDAEWYEIPAATVMRISEARAAGGRVVAVGTTTTRALESAAAQGSLQAGAGWAHLFITPGHRFRVINALFTNFHLPRSTLLLLVSAFAGRDHILAAYAEAVAQRYRFYSYGDAMLIQ
jgi:S-adenosylmethionine:tRNA ribosyltransferase-isomerase